MRTEKGNKTKLERQIGTNFFDQLWDESWTYIKTVVDVVEVPLLILDCNFRVKAANESFYKKFQTNSKETEENTVFKLGDGQWNIPTLEKLLREIITKQVFFKGFEVACDFPQIGYRVMILNARQIYLNDKGDSNKFPPVILLAIEDVTEMMAIAETLAEHTNKSNTSLSDRTEKLEIQLAKLVYEMKELKKIQ